MAQLISKAKDPLFWTEVRESEDYRPIREEIAAQYESLRGDIPAVRYSEFIIYNVTGSRKEYERSYFTRRKQMNTAAALAMIYPDNEEYMTRLADIIWAILDEYVWVLPAHMPSFTENITEHIDLFAAETAFALTEIDYILGDRLPQLIRSRIRAEVERRTIQPFLNHHHSWENYTHNWASVCMGSVFAAFVYLHPELIPVIRPRVEETMRKFMSGYPNDGACLEGFGYWSYGFGFFTMFADLAYDFTDGEWSYWDDPHVKAAACFQQKMFIDGPVVVSFSDSGDRGSPPLGIWHYLKKKYPDDINLLPREQMHIHDGCGRWGAFIRSILWYNPGNDPLPGERRTVENFFPDAQWLLKTAPSYGFAAKGGINMEPHNHNDLGSFIVSVGGWQILCDLGSGTYSKSYFGSHRYENFNASSRGHSVPIINGTYQLAGVGRYASETIFENGIFTTEFHLGYDIPELTELKRSFTFTDSSLMLTDTYKYNGTPDSFIERFVTKNKPVIKDDGVAVGPLMLKASCGDVTVTCEADGRGGSVYTIDYTVPNDAREFVLNIAVSD